MRKMLTALCTAVGIWGCAPTQKSLTVDQAKAAISIDEFFGYLTDLSSDDMRGRDTGSPGFDSATEYVIRRIEELGLEPAGENGSYRQSITFRKATQGEAFPQVRVAGRRLRFGEHYALVPQVDREQVDMEAPIVFVGFGISAPEVGYDNYQGIDVTGKVVMFIQNRPPGLKSLENTVLGRSKNRVNTARAKGALGVIRVLDQTSLGQWPLASAKNSSSSFGYVDPFNRSPVQLVLNYRQAGGLLQLAGKDYRQVRQQLLAGNPQSFELGFDLSVKASFRHEEILSQNIAALLPGKDKTLGKEVVVLSAHLDHVGVKNPIRGDSIYNGTLDNASGSAGILTLAGQFAAMKPPKRSILFLWVTAEEKGLLGSDYWAKYPTITASRIVANHNIDMINGAFLETSDMIAYGYEHSNLSRSVDYALKELSMTRSEDPVPEENYFVRSDQYSFVKQGIPAIWVWRGRDVGGDMLLGKENYDAWFANNYHRPSDDMNQPMSERGLLEELQLNFLMTYYIANEMQSIDWYEDSFLYQRYGK